MGSRAVKFPVMAKSREKHCDPSPNGVLLLVSTQLSLGVIWAKAMKPLFEFVRNLILLMMMGTASISDGKLTTLVNGGMPAR